VPGVVTIDGADVGVPPPESGGAVGVGVGADPGAVTTIRAQYALSSLLRSSR
jgi:hypothetical protein